jgi:four helix bundle protein
MSASLRDLKVWQEAVALAAEVITAARRSARREIKVVTEAMMTTALDVAGSIAEGTGFHDPESQQASYRGARQALLRLESQLAVARQAGLIEDDSLTMLSRKASSVARLLGGYLVYLERQTSAADR